MQRVRAPVDAPHSGLDLYSDDVLFDPYPAYAELRELGPVVWMSRFGAYALARHEQVRSALQDWQTFSSAAGVGLDAEANKKTAGAILTSDPPVHDSLRKVMNAQLSGRVLSTVVGRIQDRADELVDGLVEQGSFDAVTELAQRYTESVIVDLVGLPDERREELLPNADAAFNTFGPANHRFRASLPGLDRLFDYVQEVAVPGRLRPGGKGMDIYDAAGAGAVPPRSCPGLMTSYVWAGMDTTIDAIGSAIWLLARHPDQWALVREDPSIIPSAFNEVLRVESPVQIFTRSVTRSVDIEGVTVPAGARVMVMFASANRDERRYADPDRFDVRRNPTDHVAFGRGIHVCVGLNLARLEGHAVLRALARRVERFEVIEERRHLNNAVRGLGSLRVGVC